MILNFHSFKFYKFLSGLITLSLGILILVALVTYNPADPSFNNAVSLYKVENYLGVTGAYIADFLLQTFGYTGIILSLALLINGLKISFNHSIKFLKLRIIFFPLLMICISIMFSFFSIIEKFDIISGGGWIGWYFKENLLKFIELNWLWPSSLIIGLFCIFITINLNPLKLLKLCAIMVKLLNAFILKLSFGKISEQRISSLDNIIDDNEIEEYNDIDNIVFENDIANNTPKIVNKIRTSLSRTKVQQTNLVSSSSDNKNYALPTIELLKKPFKKVMGVNKAFLEELLLNLTKVLEDFGIKGQIVEVRPGPVVTLFELEPAAGTKSSRIIGLSDDIARSISALSARIAVVPGKNLIGIELPNKDREIVLLREIFEHQNFINTELKLPLALGKNIGGEAVIADLSKMPHLLVAGTTGSGKSVAINTMVLSLLYKLTPDQCRFIMIDPKMLELSVYDGIPHLLAPVVTDPGKAVVALKWVVKEMENRYRLMSNFGVRNISGFNEKILNAKLNGVNLTRTMQTGFDMETGKPIYEKTVIDNNPLPFIVVIVDEMADLMLVAGKDIEASIQRLAQMARAAGIHLIMATQRPSVDVITGVIKANFPTRISFQVTSKIDSRTILGEQGAEQLLGMGDMLYMAGGSKITRVHGPFVSDHEVEQIVQQLKLQGEPEYIEDITKDPANDAQELDNLSGDGSDSLYKQAVQIVLRDKKASTSYIQRCLKIGYNKAATIIEQMERENIIGPANHVGKREILVNHYE